MLAELLEMPALTFARKVDLDGDTIQIERQTAAGYDVVSSPLPALVSVTSGAVEPRYPTFKGIMQAKQKPIDEPSCADLGVSDVGAAGSGQTISAVRPAPERAAGAKVQDEGEAHLDIVTALENAKVI